MYFVKKMKTHRVYFKHVIQMINNSLNNYVQRDADTWCLCKNLSNSVLLDQAIVFDISAIIMFSRSESYKLFPLLSITSVYNIWNNIFSFSLYLR